MAETIQPAEMRQAVLTDHAREQMAEREITVEQIQRVLTRPEEVLPVRPGRVVAQSVVEVSDGRRYLLRVFVDADRKPPEIVTVYRTSKIEKYRSRP
jgi:hypothetical protein